MELSTRCPECETVFPVSLEQLQLRKGYIRCVQCANIFDGFEEAVPADGPRANPTAAPAQPFSIGASRVAPAAAEPPLEHSIPAGAPLVTDEAQPEPRIPAVVRQRSDLRQASRPVADPFTISEPALRSNADREEPLVPVHGQDATPAFSTSWGDDAPQAAQNDNDDYLYIEPRHARRSGQYQPEFMAEAQPRRGGLAALWFILTVLGLLLLFAQGIYVYRAQLANNFPNLRPVLESACENLGCTVPYDRRIEAIAITGSALRSSGAPEEGVSQLVLEVVLRNAFERPQEWPTLVLDLKDASGTVVVRRNLGPEIWVPEQQRSAPFAPNSEIKVQVPIMVKGLQANGYQLDKFFP